MHHHEYIHIPLAVLWISLSWLLHIVAEYIQPGLAIMLQIAGLLAASLQVIYWIRKLRRW